MKNITIDKLKMMGGLYFKTVMEGMDYYPYERKSCSEEEAVSWMISLSKEHPLYADFYVGRITKESLTAFKECLSNKEYAQLLNLLTRCKQQAEEEFLIFLPEENELELLIKMSYRGLFFSTFYMVQPAMTIWSNFDGEFLVFTKE